MFAVVHRQALARFDRYSTSHHRWSLYGFLQWSEWRSMNKAKFTANIYAVAHIARRRQVLPLWKLELWGVVVCPEMHSKSYTSWSLPFASPFGLGYEISYWSSWKLLGRSLYCEKRHRVLTIRVRSLKFNLMASKFIHSWSFEERKSGAVFSP